MRRILSLTIATLFAVSTAASATVAVANSKTVSPTLQVSATVQSAVSLTLAAGATTGISHCSVAAGSDYTMAFGTVDALAVNAGNCNVYAPATPGTGSAIYWSDYTLTPIWAGQATQTTPTITAYVSTNFTANTGLTVVRDTNNSSTKPLIGGFSNMSTVSSGDTIATGSSAIVNNTPITRFIGLSVAPTATVGLNTPQTATVTFTLTLN
jgi:hypothetical protein